MNKYVSTPATNRRIYEIRVALGYTQVEMSNYLGYSRSYFGKVEADPNIKINKNVVLAICRAFNVNYDYLAFGEGSMFNEFDARKRAVLELYDELPETYQKFLHQYVVFLAEHSKEDMNAPDLE